MKNLSLTIGWLYPTLMSTYGDRGNIMVLYKRLSWRGIDVTVKELNEGFSVKDLESCDLLFMGGAQDKQQKIVMEDLAGKKAEVLKQMIEDGIPGLYICGAFQFLGNYYKEADGTKLDGLGILDLYTENPGLHVKRLIGNTVIDVSKDIDISDKTIVGFENHGGRTFLGENSNPFGTVVVGFGNNGEDQTEGAHYKNSFGSYFHGPILPKNPHFADYLITLALEKKYKKEIQLDKLDNDLEEKAHKQIVKRLEE